jgi:hypothetical protein
LASSETYWKFITRFRGSNFDAETGLQYNPFRDYDPDPNRQFGRGAIEMKKSRKQLVVKSYYCADIDNLYAWNPDRNRVFYHLDMNIGLSAEDAADTYSVTIATPEGISSLSDKDITSDQIYKIILMAEYSWEKVISIIESIVSKIDVTYEFDVQDKLRSYFHWEYESMR